MAAVKTAAVIVLLKQVPLKTPPPFFVSRREERTLPLQTPDVCHNSIQKLTQNLVVDLFLEAISLA